MNTVTCPLCGGYPESGGFYFDAFAGCVTDNIEVCRVCNGAGEIPSELAEWVRKYGASDKITTRDDAPTYHAPLPIGEERTVVIKQYVLNHYTGQPVSRLVEEINEYLAEKADEQMPITYRDPDSGICDCVDVNSVFLWVEYSIVAEDMPVVENVIKNMAKEAV